MLDFLEIKFDIPSISTVRSRSISRLGSRSAIPIFLFSASSWHRELFPARSVSQGWVYPTSSPSTGVVRTM